MTTLTASELELLERLIAHYEDRAQRFDSMHNRPMAERQKAIELEKVALLKKLKKLWRRRRVANNCFNLTPTVQVKQSVRRTLSRVSPMAKARTTRGR